MTSKTLNKFLKHSDYPLEKSIEDYGEVLSQAIGLINNAYRYHDDPRSHHTVGELIRFRDYLERNKTKEDKLKDLDKSVKRWQTIDKFEKEQKITYKESEYDNGYGK